MTDNVTRTDNIQIPPIWNINKKEGKNQSLIFSKICMKIERKKNLEN